MCSLINKQLLLTAYAYLSIMEQQKGQQGSDALQEEKSKEIKLKACGDENMDGKYCYSPCTLVKGLGKKSCPSKVCGHGFEPVVPADLKSFGILNRTSSALFKPTGTGPGFVRRLLTGLVTVQLPLDWYAVKVVSGTVAKIYGTKVEKSDDVRLLCKGGLSFLLLAEFATAKKSQEVETMRAWLKKATSSLTGRVGDKISGAISEAQKIIAFLILTGRKTIGKSHDTVAKTRTAIINEKKSSFLALNDLEKGSEVWKLFVDECIRQSSNDIDLDGVILILTNRFDADRTGSSCQEPGYYPHVSSDLSKLHIFLSSKPTRSSSMATTGVPAAKLSDNGGGGGGRCPRRKTADNAATHAKSLVKFLADDLKTQEIPGKSIIAMISSGGPRPEVKDSWMYSGSSCQLWAIFFAHLYLRYNVSNSIMPSLARGSWENEMFPVDHSNRRFPENEKLYQTWEYLRAQEEAASSVGQGTRYIQIPAAKFAADFRMGGAVNGDTHWETNWAEQVMLGPGAAIIQVPSVAHYIYVDWTDPHRCRSLQGWFIGETAMTSWTPEEMLDPSVNPMQTRTSIAGGLVSTAQQDQLKREQKLDAKQRISQLSPDFLKLKKEFGEGGVQWKCDRLREMFTLINNMAGAWGDSSDGFIHIITNDKPELEARFANLLKSFPGEEKSPWETKWTEAVKEDAVNKDAVNKEGLTESLLTVRNLAQEQILRDMEFEKLCLGLPQQHHEDLRTKWKLLRTQPTDPDFVRASPEICVKRAVERMQFLHNMATLEQKELALRTITAALEQKTLQEEIEDLKGQIFGDSTQGGSEEASVGALRGEIDTTKSAKV